MMKKIIKSFVCFLLITALSNASVLAKNTNSLYLISSSLLVPPNPPTVNGSQYYCINDVVTLTATASAGGILNWYGTNASGGTSSATAPIPSTLVSGSTTYYVSQTVAGEESSRASIVVNVDKQLGLFCDATKTTSNSVGFDFANVGQSSFTYSYTISGGSPVTGVWSAPSNYVVTGVLPGQSVTFTITAIGAPSCVISSQTETCNSDCTIAQIITPTFGTTPTSYCLNDVVVLPTTSTNGITGTWSPIPVDTSTMGANIYTFTPNPTSFPCALKTTLRITVEPIVPDFNDFSLCFGDIAPTLSPVSPNGITGVWNPTTVDNMNSASYVFTPDPGQPCTPSIKTINVTVNLSNTILSLNWTVTDAFTKNQIVTITNPVGANYLYQMDSGPFQASPLFENVASGLHSISVNDLNGCSKLTDSNVLVIGYPKYFTPNGDTYNDNWNISGLSDQLNCRIYIFDRYGKLLKDISPKELGWDGTYIGQPMPADDYWFTVEYSEQNSIKKFNSHFSLKR
ncbi:T9SS type B sorting domain-containing protein [Flavobacterium franklandianum]|uniref:T9SS type B sorting domain-containing protein n=1 Tax=Flavobacterium franklandianum TaxID=2594430 RepID=UPI0011798F07|nr:T9SS type B sorting domain-containing protein [Flavobacterium franklandianum]TRX23315.1 T9SS type B sorting domain-containing protein [Flavobacterium franklandianum]